MDKNGGYRKPRSVEEAIALRCRYDGAVLLAGGTDLMVRLPRPYGGVLIDLAGAGPGGLVGAADVFSIGATVTAHRLATEPRVREHLPLLAAAALQLGSPQIRSRATIGGNTINASPAADLSCALAALEAAASLQGPHARCSIWPGAQLGRLAVHARY